MIPISPTVYVGGWVRVCLNKHLEIQFRIMLQNLAVRNVRMGNKTGNSLVGRETANSV